MSKFNFLSNEIKYTSLLLDNDMLQAHYYFFDKNYTKLEEILLLAIENNKSNIYALLFLAEYYRITVNDFKTAKKYYIMAITYNCVDSMLKLAEYYYNKHKYNKMIYYYKLAANNNNILAMYNLGIYYKAITNYDDMIKYFSMASLHGDIPSIKYLVQYYHSINNNEEKYKYLLMIYNYTNSLDILGCI